MTAEHVKFMNDSHYYEGERVSFMKMGLKMAGLVFKPENFDAGVNAGKKYPAIVVTHPGGGVKEQVVSLYGWNLSKKGYVAIAFDAFQYIDTVSPRPLLLIVGSNADTIYFSEDAYQRAKEPKELYVIESATHVDLYDKPEFVPQVVEKLTEFFDKNIK